MPTDKSFYYFNATKWGLIDQDDHLHIGFTIPENESPLPVNNIFFRITPEIAEEIVELLQVHLERRNGGAAH